MGRLELIAAFVVAASAILMEAEAGKYLMPIGYGMQNDMQEILSLKDQADAEKTFSFAEKYISKLEGSQKQTGEELLKAWDRVLHHADECDESSLAHLETISRYNQQYSMLALREATEKYARKCLTPAYIANKTEPQVSDYLLKSHFKNITEFVDDQFIADYWSDNPEDNSLEDIKGLKATKAMVKAIIRDSASNIEGLKDVEQAHTYLDERLYKPCSEYLRALEELNWSIYFASVFLEGGRDKLIFSLDHQTLNAFFRYQLCDDPEIQRITYWTSVNVASALESLPAN